jgi:NADPH-dependent glutamate synthase beta subunit-like oxidoreductase
VAVIGSGVAGLTCAHDLAILGHQVTVFEAQSVPGGMLVLGVPEYRLPRELVRAEIQAILDLGVQLELNTALGKEISLQDLRRMGYEAIFLAIGAHKSRDLRLDGIQADGRADSQERRQVPVRGDVISHDAEAKAQGRLVARQLRGLLTGEFGGEQARPADGGGAGKKVTAGRF